MADTLLASGQVLPGAAACRLAAAVADEAEIFNLWGALADWGGQRKLVLELWRKSLQLDFAQLEVRTWLETPEKSRSRLPLDKQDPSVRDKAVRLVEVLLEN